MRFAVVHELQYGFAVVELCRQVECSGAGYYKLVRRYSAKPAKDVNDRRVSGLVRQVSGGHRIYGYRRVVMDLETPTRRAFSQGPSA